MNNTENEMTNVVELVDDQLKEVAGGGTHNLIMYYASLGKRHDQYAKLGLSKEEYQKMKAELAAKGYQEYELEYIFAGLC